MNKLFQCINALFGGIVRKQSLIMNKDGTFTCTSNGKSHRLKHLLEGLVED